MAGCAGHPPRAGRDGPTPARSRTTPAAAEPGAGAATRAGMGHACGAVQRSAAWRVLTLTESTGPAQYMAYRSVPAQMSARSSLSPSSPSSLCKNWANAFILSGLPPTQTNWG